ncbi:MAG: adenylate kinase [Candidatus Dormibacteraeota bacterium]|nr:adenylate kinase [Candidatus Dormibacteraeota bacterium]
MVNLTLFGPPGSGKGTQAKFLVQHFAIPQVSTGELLRAAANAGTEVGLRAREYMNRGELVPDDTTLDIFRGRLERDDCAQGVLLDGFPRTVAQADALDRMLGALHRRLDRVIYIKVPDDVLIGRLSGRLTCPVDGLTYHPVLKPPRHDKLCDRDGTPLIERQDDKPETARHRIGVYMRQTLPVIDHYRGRGLVAEIDGEGEIEAIKSRILDSIEDPAQQAGVGG